MTQKSAQVVSSPPSLLIRKSEVEDVPNRRWNWTRVPGILFGLGTQLLFLFTVWHLFFFLRDGATNQQVETHWSNTLIWDLLLTLQFAVIHSVLLHPSMRRKLTRWIPSPFYGSLFCVSTCVTLLLTIALWKPSTYSLFESEGTALFVIRCGFYGAWIALFYSLYISGLGYQTGWTPWWAWFQHKPQPRREFEVRGAYRLFRHPIYLSFLGLIWFTPQMTLDHVVLTGMWTIYIFIGSYLKDERMAFYVGDRYREYQSRVPGYPFLRWSPLGLRQHDPAEKKSNPAEISPAKAA